MSRPSPIRTKADDNKPGRQIGRPPLHPSVTSSAHGNITIPSDRAG